MSQPWPHCSWLKGSFVTDEHVLDPLSGRKQKESLRTLAWNIKMLPRGFHLLKAKRESSALTHAWSQMLWFIVIGFFSSVEETHLQT